MLRRAVVAAILVAAVGLAGFWFLTRPARVAADSLSPHNADLGNGRTMFFAGGCASCHATPNQEDKTKLGGGFALNSPFGTFYVPNISPHRADGIGAWSEAQFVGAVIKGTSPGGAHLYPAFPYTSYQRMRIDDVRDLFAFLKTLAPVAGRARDHDLRFPYNVRRGVGLWKLVYLDGAPFAPDASQTAAWNRGAYLVNGPGHCAECHSPRNFIGAIVAGRRFTGGPSPEGEGWIPNITQFALKDWSQEDIAEFLKTGQSPGGQAAGGRMVTVVHNLAELAADDLAAMAAYVKSLPPVEGERRRVR